MMFNVLRYFHPMIGVDWHIPVLPPGPLPAPVPYMTMQVMGNPISLTTLYCTTVYADSVQGTMCKGTDIGLMIPHIGPFSIIIAIEMVMAASKSHFGPSAIQVTDQHGGDGNPAAAVLVTMNLNLNCGFPFPSPLGFVLTFNTTAVGMTWGDIIGGLFAMAMDWLLQTIINIVCAKYLGFVGEFFDKWGRRLASRLGIRTLSRGVARSQARELWKAAGKKGPLGEFQRMLQRQAAARLERFVGNFVLAGENVVSFLIGSPLGTAVDMPGSPVPSLYGGARGLAEDAGIMATPEDVQQMVDAPPQSSPPANQSTPPPDSTSTPPADSPPTPPPDSTATPPPDSTATPPPDSTATPEPNQSTPPPDEPNACYPEDSVNDYLNDPSVEDVGN